MIPARFVGWLQIGFLHPIVDGFPRPFDTELFKLPIIFEGYYSGKWGRIPSCISSLGVRSRSTNSNSIQSLRPLRRVISAIDQHQITTPHSSFLTKHDHFVSLLCSTLLVESLLATSRAVLLCEISCYSGSDGQLLSEVNNRAPYQQSPSEEGFVY